MERNFPYMIIIWLSQILGAVFGVFVSFITLNQIGEDPATAIHTPKIAMLCPGISAAIQEGNTFCSVLDYQGQVFLMELIASFVFYYVCLTCGYHYGSDEQFINAMTIGGALFGTICVAGGVSGACLNPAIGIVQPVFQQMVARRYPANFDNKVPSIDTMWIYIVSPLCAGILAGLFKHYNDHVLKQKDQAAKLEDYEMKNLKN